MVVVVIKIMYVYSCGMIDCRYLNGLRSTEKGNDGGQSIAPAEPASMSFSLWGDLHYNTSTTSFFKYKINLVKLSLSIKLFALCRGERGSSR